MKNKLIVLLLCSLCSLTACGSVEEPVKTVQALTPQKRVVNIDEVPTFEEVLFIEVPGGDEPARDFLDMIKTYDLTVKHVTVKDYDYGNYTLDCTFNTEGYSILIYVRPEEGLVKWYGNLKHNDEILETWKYVVYT